MLTFSREAWEAANAAWRAGAFGSEWIPIRTLAAERGFIFPPSGSAYDDPEATRPSQRAIIHQAMQDTPHLLRDAISRSRDWSEVVAIVIARRRALREDVHASERDALRERKVQPGREAAAESLSAILSRIQTGGGGYHRSGGS